MKIIIKLSLLLLALLLPATANAYDFEVDGIYYNINGNNATVTDADGVCNTPDYSGDVTIPETVTYNGTTYSVTGIGESAFDSCSGLTSVTIPNSVTSIGSSAFDGCSRLTSINIPNSVTSIGERTFAGCSGLTSIDIPNSVTAISLGAFWGCSGLTSVDIPNSVTSIGDWAFVYCSGLTNVNIPNSVVSIGGKAFAGCSGLTSINIPNSVTSIGTNAFEACSGLTDLIWNARNCFNNGNMPTSSIERVTIGNEVEVLPSYFVYDSKITTVAIPNSVISIGGCAFSGCSRLTSANIPNSVISIGDRAFSGCSGLTSANIPNSVISIGDGAFSGCSGLTSVNIPNSVISIGNETFSCCSGLTSVNIPNSVISIGDGAFYDCIGVTEIDISNSVTSIGDEAFEGTAWYNNQPDGLVYAGLVAYKYKGTMPNGTSITLSDETLGIACGAFRECNRLTDINLPNSITTIGNFAFYNCLSLTNLEIPNSVTSIGEYALDGTAWYDNQPDGLVYAGLVAYRYKGAMPDGTSITLSDGTLGIAGAAFYDCLGLTSVNIPNSVNHIGNIAFNGCRNLASINIPNSITSIGHGAFSYCTSLTRIDIPSTVTSIGVGAFNHCFELNEVYSFILDPSLVLMGSGVFDNYVPKKSEALSSDYYVRTLHVPVGTISSYQNLEMSTYFDTIVEMAPGETNYFSMADTTVWHGDVITIPVHLDNNLDLMAFQTDIFLPEGFTIVTDEDDEYLITPSQRLTSDHVIMSDNANNGAVRVICYTPNSQLISGNDGDLFYIHVQVPDDAEGPYTINVRNTLLTTVDYNEISVPDTSAIIEVIQFIPGDVNDSRTVNVTDIVVTAMYVLDKNPSPFVFEAADMNGDGNVTVTDIMLIAYLINHPTMNAPKRMPALMDSNDRMSGESVSLMAGETRTVSIELNNEMDYTAFQMDLTLPEGLTASNFQLTDRAGSHAFDVSTLSNGDIRALCYSPAIEVIDGHSGALLTFDVTATDAIEGDITVDGIEFVTTDCQSVLLNGFAIGVNTTTSVNEVANGKTVARVDYFNLAGQRIDRPESGVTLVVTTYTDGTRTTTKLHRK